ncbi:hypothetical protein TNCV_3040071 [Trichonephila clavipes]|nr:hypothetical protein TNCV_3040071 [Trichonephila clavipes]
MHCLEYALANELVAQDQYFIGPPFCTDDCSDLFGVKGHHTTPMNLAELWTALANVWQVIPVERFHKLVESMPRRVATVMKARGGAQLVTR